MMVTERLQERTWTRGQMVALSNRSVVALPRKGPAFLFEILAVEASVTSLALLTWRLQLTKQDLLVITNHSG
jgi:hypothetical protein